MVNFIPSLYGFSAASHPLSKCCSPDTAFVCVVATMTNFFPHTCILHQEKERQMRSLLEEAARNQQTQKMEVDRLKTQVRRYHGSKCHHLRQKLVKATRYREFDYHSYIQLVIGCFVSCPTMEFVMLRLQEKPLEV